MSIGDVFVALGFKVDDKQLKDFDKAIVGLKNNMFALAAEGISTVYAIDKVSTGIKNAFDNAINLKNLNRETGFSTLTAQIWEATGALNAFNVSKEETLSSLASVSSKIAENYIKGNFSTEMARLGISHTDKPEIAIEEARRAAQTNPLYQGNNGAQLFTNDVKSALGLTAGMAAQLRYYKTPEAQKEDALAHGAILSDDQIEKIVRAKTAVQELEGSFSQLYSILAVNLTPQIEHLSKYLNTAADGLKFVLDKLDKNNSKSTASVYKERHAKNGFYGDITNQVHATAHAVPEVIGTGISEIGDYLGKGIIWWLNDNDVSQQTKPGAPAKPRWPQIIDNTTSNNPKIAPLPNFGLKPGNDNGALDLQNIDKILSPLNGGSLPANSTNHSWNVKIDVNGSEKPHETAMEVRRQIEDLTTFQQFGNGGLA